MVGSVRGMVAPFSLVGRAALVTGAGAPDGIGFATARLLGRMGARVVVSATSDRVHERAGELSAEGIDALALLADLTDPVQSQRLVDETDVTRAITTPPENTRAYFRGECLRRFGADVAAASWDSVIFDLGGDSLVRIPTLEPLRGSRAHVGSLLDSVDSAAELVDQLTT